MMKCCGGIAGGHLPGREHGNENGTGRLAGFTLVELMVAVVLIVVAMSGYLHSIVKSSMTAEENRRMALATQQARETIELMKSTNFDDVFVTFNADPADDLGGAGTANGATFVIAGLQAPANDLDGIVGQILFPTVDATPGALREDLANPAFGTPRDLNGDGIADGADHSGDYQLLPVVVRAAWRSSRGTARIEFKTVLFDL